jgi:hypothetical protein
MAWATRTPAAMGSRAGTRRIIPLFVIRSIKTRAFKNKTPGAADQFFELLPAFRAFRLRFVAHLLQDLEMMPAGSAFILVSRHIPLLLKSATNGFI